MTSEAARQALLGVPTTGVAETFLVPRARKAPAATRESAVLMVFGRGEGARTPAGRTQQERLAGLGASEVDVLLLQRSWNLAHHPGQVAFPGGGREEHDLDLVDTALREAREETGIDTNGVEVLSTFESLYIPVSKFLVTPVLAWWEHPTPVSVMDTGESKHVARVAVADLVAPENRGAFSPLDRAYSTPAFDAGVFSVWGFTAGLLDYVLHAAGWDVPWDPERRIDVEF